MKRTLAATAIAVLLGTGGAFAQEVTDEQRAEELRGFHDSLAVVESTVDREFTRLGVEHDPGDLTLRQLLEIHATLNEVGPGDPEELERIEQIIEGGTTPAVVQ